MLANEPAHIWLSRFCIRLVQLRPDMTLASAARRSVAAFTCASEMDPEDAAKIYDAAVALSMDLERSDGASGCAPAS